MKRKNIFIQILCSFSTMHAAFFNIFFPSYTSFFNKCGIISSWWLFTFNVYSVLMRKSLFRMDEWSSRCLRSELYGKTQRVNIKRKRVYYCEVCFGDLGRRRGTLFNGTNFYIFYLFIVFLKLCLLLIKI